VSAGTPRRKSEPSWTCHATSDFPFIAQRKGFATVALKQAMKRLGDEAFDPLLEMLPGREVAAAEELANQDRVSIWLIQEACPKMMHDRADTT
jgi:hypothetical protein